VRRGGRANVRRYPNARHRRLRAASRRLGRNAASTAIVGAGLCWSRFLSPRARRDLRCCYALDDPGIARQHGGNGHAPRRLGATAPTVANGVVKRNLFPPRGRSGNEKPRRAGPFAAMRRRDSNVRPVIPDQALNLVTRPSYPPVACQIVRIVPSRGRCGRIGRSGCCRGCCHALPGPSARAAADPRTRVELAAADEHQGGVGGRGS
jgi:hypothetical protein